MAQKKLLVLGSDGRIQQIQSGDTLVGATETGDISLTPGASHIAGQVVYISGNDAATKAQANGSTASKAIALATAAVSSGSPGTYRTNGVLTLTTAEWDALAGTTGGLTAGASYFLSAATAGLITSTPPTTTGQYVVLIGKAVSTIALDIKIQEPILL